MRARCHQRPARLAVFCLAAIALLVTATWARADDPAVRDRVAGLRTANQSLAAHSQNALLELYSLQTRLAQAEQRITALEVRSTEVEEQRVSAQTSLDVARTSFQTAQAQLAARLRQLYVEGDVDPLAVLLGAESLDEIVSALDGLNRLATQDKEIVAQLAHAKVALRAASARLADREAELKDLLADARATRAALAAARDARAAYLASIRHRQQCIERLERDHFGPQAAPDTAQFQADYPGADHAQALGHLRKFECAPGINDPLPVERE